MNEVAVQRQVGDLHRQALSSGLPVSLAWLGQWFRDQASSETESPILVSVATSFFKSDLKASGIGSLPAGLLEQHNIRLQGFHVLQIERVANIAEPLTAGEGGLGGSNRLLKFEMTDGKALAYAIEYRRIKQLDGVRLLKNSKIIVMGSPVVRRGLILLQDSNVRLIWSGECESSAETTRRLHSANETRVSTVRDLSDSIPSIQTPTIPALQVPAFAARNQRASALVDQGCYRFSTNRFWIKQ